MKSSVSAKLVEKADKRRGMTLAELRAFLVSCADQGIPDYATLKVQVGMKRQIHEIVATVDGVEPSKVEHETQQILERAPRTWVLARSLHHAELSCDSRGIARVIGMPLGTRVVAVTPRSLHRMRGVSIVAGDKLLQVKDTPDSVVAKFEENLVASGLTYADLEILL